jgi:phosphoglycolate phosphatase
MRYGLLLWDFDGTLADTLASSLQLYNELAVRHGFRPVADAQAARGLTPLQFLRDHGIPMTKAPLLMREIRAAHRKHMADTPLFDSLLPVLEAIRQSGRCMGILSSNSRGNILACLRANHVEGLFDPVISYSRLLGKARPLRRVLRTGDLAGGDVLYVGDEVRDIEAAREAGVAVAAVTWGFNARDLLADHSPDYLIDRPEQLLQVLG